MKFNYDYATHQWVLSIMVGFFLSKVITTLAKHISNRENTTFYLPYYLQMLMAFIYFIYVWYGYSPTISLAGEGQRIVFLLMIIGDLIPVLFFQLVLADEEDLQKEIVDLETIYFRNIKVWPALAIVYFIVTGINEYLLQDVMPDSIMIINSSSFGKLVFRIVIPVSVYLITIFWKNERWHTYTAVLMCLTFGSLIFGY